MKDLKDIILDRRIRNLEIEGKQVPDKYISVFNSYLEQIAESLTDYTKQVRKEVLDEICVDYAKRLSAFIGVKISISTAMEKLKEVLDQIQGEQNGSKN